MDEKKKQIDRIFNRLRARLYSQLETAGLSNEQCKAMKQAVKDFTGLAWNDITKIIEEEKK